MKKSIISLFAIAALSGTALTGCQDMMTVETGDKTYQSAQDTLYSYLGIMRAMQDVAERQVILGEIRGDLVQSTGYTTDTLYAISNFDNPQDQSCSMLQVSDYYNVINNCNFYIHHADTSAIKSNIKYMVPEYAQVKAIRAWAYLQLVKNYKEVPYVTEPINSLDFAKNFDYANNKVNKDNLIDLMLKDGILDFVDTRYPQYGSGNTQYGSWNNGFTDISARLCFIPIRVLLGDMYLLRGESETDYEKAATYYFDYLKNETTPMYKQYCTVINLLNEIRYNNEGGWGNWAQTYTYSASTNEVISLIPGSSNAGLGNMLTRVADIYGYTPTSSQSNDESTDEDGETTGEFESSGAITVTRNYKRQYCPSEAYSDVNNDQTYVNYNGTSPSTSVASYIRNTDARYYAVENYSTVIDGQGGAYPLCSKAARGDAFYYTIPIYRKSLIWLRMAEAINRAGYPEFAFAILKDGLNQYSLPKIVDRYPEVFNEDGYGVYVRKSTGNEFRYLDYATGTWYEIGEDGEYAALDKAPSGYIAYRDTIAGDSVAYSSTGHLYYLTGNVSEVSAKLDKFSKFLNFKDDIWNSTYGIHAKGCGFGRWSSANQGEVITNITGYLDSVHYDYSKLILAQGVDVETASQDELIDAVENIIVDELALETAFEGNRFTDLVRIAEHKNDSGINGTDWLANKIANRGTRKAVPNRSDAVEGFNSEIFGKLQNQSNWYFQLPAWR